MRSHNPRARSVFVGHLSLIQGTKFLQNGHCALQTALLKEGQASHKGPFRCDKVLLTHLWSCSPVTLPHTAGGSFLGSKRRVVSSLCRGPRPAPPSAQPSSQTQGRWCGAQNSFPAEGAPGARGEGFPLLPSGQLSTQTGPEQALRAKPTRDRCGRGLPPSSASAACGHTRPGCAFTATHGSTSYLFQTNHFPTKTQRESFLRIRSHTAQELRVSVPKLEKPQLKFWV